MGDETTSTATLTDGAVRWIDRNGAATRAEVRALAAELLAARETIARQVEQLRAADALADEDDARERRLRELLTGVAVALRGPQPPGGLWSWHDLPERAAAARAQARRAAIEEAAAVCFALAYSSDWPGDQEQDRAATYAHAASEVRALLTPEPREGA